MSTDRIARRVACRELAQQYAGLISQDMDVLSDDSLCGVFWTELVLSGPLAEMLKWKSELTKPPIDPMSDAATVEFEKRKLYYGEHAGKRLKDVPKRELDRMIGGPMKFYKDLERYLASDRVRNEIEHEETP